MINYADKVATIRAARDARDKARDELYREQIRSFNLTREQKKYDNKELSRNPAIDRNIAEIRGQRSDLQAQSIVIANQLQGMQTAEDQLKAQRSAREVLAADLNVLQLKVQSIDSEALSKNISFSRSTELDLQNKMLRESIIAEKQLIKELDEEIAALSGAGNESKDKQANLTQQKRILDRQLIDLQEKLSTILLKSPEYHPDETEHLSSSKIAIQGSATKLKELSASVHAAIGSLFVGQEPQQLIEQWNDSLPILLFPVRVETKYSNSTAEKQKQLLVRIFPDDIAVVTHEKLLTQAELDAGHSHWKALWLAEDNSIQKKASWNLLEKQCGVNRAAWVAVQTKPENWISSSGLATADDLKFPNIDITKPSAWTQAPHTRTMPDKFVLMGYRESKTKESSGKKLIFSKVGSQVGDIVVLGPAPLENGDSPSLTRDPKQDNRIQYGEDFKWMADFNTAVQSGLGFVVTDGDLASGSVVDGFDYLVALGIKSSCDDSDGKDLLEDLLDNHNYSKEGLSLIKQGTPTNNTEEKDAGFSKKGTIADRSNNIEKGEPLFKPSLDKKSATDGQRLAEYLGISYQSLQLVPNSQLNEYAESVAMNTALYASTLGYFMQSMLNDVLPDADRVKLRDHFTQNVVGRGPLAAIRVGNQPYGIIPTSAFAKWNYPPRPTNREVRMLSAEDVFADDFLSHLYAFLRYFEGEWQKFVPNLPTIHQQGDAGANLMSVLGLNPSSVEFYQRIGYSLDYLKNLEAFNWGGKYMGDVVNTILEQAYVKQILNKFGYTGSESDGNPKPVPLLLQLVFQHYHSRLDNNNLIDGQPTSEEATIKPYDQAGQLNFIDWLLSNVSNSAKLENLDFGGAVVPNSMLFMLLRNSLLLETSHSLHAYLQNNNIEANELICSRKFMNMSSAPSVSPWEIFQAPANKVVSTGASDQPLFEFIHSPYFSGSAGKGVTQNLDDFKWALGTLNGMSTASLERAMTEHLDTLSYRLDAWQTSLFDLRLQGQRNILAGNAERTTGVYLGAYGYLENVKPSAGKRTRIAEEALPAALREGKDNIYTETSNGGYVHAPSLNHAAAAAILRCGYLTHANPDDRDMLSINLSSERVRRAKYLIDGIRNGQTLEVLLGYQFERGLQDWTTRPDNPVVVNHVVPLFREAFPIKKTKVPQAGNVTGPEEVVDDYQVTNGLALSLVESQYPFGISALPSLIPPLSADQINALDTEKANIANTLDALRDVLTSESAYQLALGNFDRAAAVMKAVSESHMPPDIQVIDSARSTDMSFTNRVCMHFKSDLTENPWPSSPMTEKAITEPGLNKWIGDLLGDPNDIRCLVKAVDKEGNVLAREDTSRIENSVSLSDLKIQPIDFMYLIRNKTGQTGRSELEERIRYFFAQKNTLDDDTIVRIEFGETNAAIGDAIKSFAEILPFVNYIKNIVSGSRPLKARDYDSASKQVPLSSDNPDNINVTELQTRVESTFGRLKSLLIHLETASNVAMLTMTEADVNELRLTLKKAADTGMVDAFPQSALGFDKKQLGMLTEQCKSVLERFSSFKKEYDKSHSEVVDVKTGIERKTSLLTEMIKSMLGDDYAVMPKFSFHDAIEVSKAHSSRSDLLTYSKDTLSIPFAVHEWLHGVSLVRPKMHTFEMMRMLNDTFNSMALQLEPIQIPHRDNDSWLAVEYPPNTQIDHDTISCICCNPQGLDPSQDQCGLLIDEWIEVIPNENEVTGISFNYNQPNSVPPQVLLLAVTPVETGKWTWDNLIDSVVDTFDRAKRRAVEPDLLDQVNGVSALLPSLLSEFSTSKNGISLDFSLNIERVRNEVMNKF